MKPKLKIVIVDSNEVYRDGLKFNLFSETFCTLIGEAASRNELNNVLRKNHPDIIILEFTGNIKHFIKDVKYLKTEKPSLKIILNSNTSEIDLKNILLEGIAGILLKESPREEVLAALKDVASGRIFVPRKIKYQDDKASRSNEQLQLKTFTDTVLSKLSYKELNVIYLVCQELSSKEIAQKTQNSVRTIEGIRRRIMKKINVKNSAGLISYALQNNILKLYE